ncbi:MAG TPA: hypothetical protein VHE14_06265 [Solirubrobacteraceae bacterium]|nr:hypothetical protein [Solirubrobacteraceae bacterium]
MTLTATVALPRPTQVASPQHLRALERANRVRLARAELKRRIAAGGLAAADVILSLPWEAEGMEVSELLLSQRRWGAARCRKLLSAIPITENKTLGSMTERQRLALVGRLTGCAVSDAISARWAQPSMG